MVDPQRRLARTAPRHHLGLVACLVVAGAGAILLAIHLPRALHAAAAVASLVAAAAGWRARPSYGRSRRMPPGSLSITRSIQAMVDRNGMICRVTLEELAAFDWTLTRDGELERDFGHWSHWRTSSRLRIRLAARGRS